MCNLIIPGLFGPGVVAIGGSRKLTDLARAIVGRFALAFLAAGHPIVCGCCTGADAAALSAAVSGSYLSGWLHILCAYGPSGAGSCSSSARAQVALAASAGASVSWWAGGQGPLVARLRARTLAVGRAAKGGGLVVFGRPDSAGSILLARCIAARRLPLVALCCGFRARSLPLVGSGYWVAVGTPAPDITAAWWQAWA